MQVHTRSLVCSKQAQLLSCWAGRPSTSAAFANKTRSYVACARSRRTSPGPQEEHVTDGEQHESQPVSESAVPLARSNRRAAASRRNARGSTLRAVVSPVQTLRDKGILAVDEAGQSFVNVACLGEGQPHWYSLALVENKEDTYIQLLSAKLAPAGYSIAPGTYTPPQPPTAAEAIAAALADKEEAAQEAAAAAEMAAAFLEEALGGPAEAAAAARVAEAQQAAGAAEKALEGARAAVEAAAAAAEASAELLQQYDLVFWKPRKKMTVYSHNSDRLVDREVAFSRGTGGATLLVHCRLDPLLAEAFAATYYFLEWRNHQPVSAVLLNQHDLLPEEAELNEVYKLPEPCSEAGLLEMANWQHTPESEDLEAERKQYYGTGGGSPFGARPERGAAKSDSSNPSRWSVSSGPTNAGAAALIAAGEPLPWETEQQQQEWASGRGRGRGRNGGGRGRGGRAAGRQQWQQQDDLQYAQAQYPDRRQGYSNQGFGGSEGWVGSSSGYGSDRGRGRGRGEGGRNAGRQQQWQQQQQQQQQWQPPPQQQRGFGVPAAAAGDADDFEPTGEDSFGEENRQHQMDWMEDMGGSRYKGGQQDFDSSTGRGSSRRWQQQQRGFAAAASGDDFEPTGEDSFGEENRQRQMDWMEDMGGSRYKEGQQEFDGRTAGGSSRWQQQQPEQQLRPEQQQQQQQQLPAAAAGQDGGTTRMRQMDYMQDMGSDRYSDDEDRDTYDRLEGLYGTAGPQRPPQQQQQRGRQQQQQQQRQGAPQGGGFDKGATMAKQLNFMADMGSGRYSDDEEGGAAADAAVRTGSRGSSGNFSSLLSEVANAFDYMDDGEYPPSFAGTVGGSPTARNNAVGGQGLSATGGKGFAALDPDKASYMDEDTLEWGTDAAGGGEVDMGVGDGGAASASAQAVLQAWQAEGPAGVNLPKGSKAGGQPGRKPYNAIPSTRSQEGLGASFEFDAGLGLASADSLLGQLPDLLSEAWQQEGAAAAGRQQQQQQQQEPPAAAATKRKSRAGTSSQRSKQAEGAAEDAAAAAAASGRRKTSGRKATGRPRQQKQDVATGTVGDVALEGWVGGADAADEGFEEGWVDRLMDDGNDRAGIDDVMQS